MNLRAARVSTRRTLANAPRPGAITIGLGVAAALAGAALYNRSQARRAERENPPVGRFLRVDGVRLHYLDEGPDETSRTRGAVRPPVVLLHGNTVTLDDWVVSGVFGLAARSRRVVAFDRPGFGYSERPRDRAWTPERRRNCFAGPVADSVSSARSSSAIPGGPWSRSHGRSRPRRR